jgi:hypothetical protein
VARARAGAPPYTCRGEATRTRAIAAVVDPRCPAQAVVRRSSRGAPRGPPPLSALELRAARRRLAVPRARPANAHLPGGAGAGGSLGRERSSSPGLAVHSPGTPLIHVGHSPCVRAGQCSCGSARRAEPPAIACGCLPTRARSVRAAAAGPAGRGVRKGARGLSGLRPCRELLSRPGPCARWRGPGAGGPTPGRGHGVAGGAPGAAEGRRGGLRGSGCMHNNEHGCACARKKERSTPVSRRA